MIKKFKIIISFLFIAIFFLNMAYQASAATLAKPLNNLGLVGWWTLDEKSGTIAHDFSGNGNSAALVNGPAWSSGKRGGAILMDTSGTQEVSVATANSALELGTSVSMSQWIYSGNVDTAYIGLAGKISPSSASNYLMEISPGTSGGTRVLDFWYVGADTSGNEWQTTNPVLPANTWTLVTTTYTFGSPSSLKVYINGNPVTGSWVTGAGTAAASVGSGKMYVASSDGKIDDVRIYNRILSGPEVLNIYNSGQTNRKTPTSNNGLIGLWNMDEATGTIAHDLSGNGKNGTLTNGPVWTVGRKAGGLLLDGNNDFIDTSNFADSLSNFTVSTWFKAQSITAQPSCGGQIVSKVSAGGASSGNGWMLALGGGGCGIASDRVYAMVQSGSGNEWVNKYTTATYNDGKWHHAVMVFSGGNTMTLYVDGSASGTNDYISGTLGSYSNSSNVRIGNNYDSEYFNGNIDETRIYNRALSASEVLALYNNSTPIVGRTQNDRISEGLVGYWSFNGQDIRVSSNTAYDRSGQGNNGTLGNMVFGTSSGPVAGKYGQGLIFDGVNDYIDAGDATILAGGSAVTVSAWIKPKTADGEIIARRDVSQSSMSWELMLISGKARFTTAVGAGSNPDYELDGLIDIDTSGNVWTHVVGVYNSVDGIIRLYINGVADTTDSAPGTINSTIGVKTYIGAYSDITTAPANMFNGSIDEVRVYNKALSPSEIKQVYLLGR